MNVMGGEERSVASLFLACRAWNRQAGLEGWIGLHLSSVGCWQVGWTGTCQEWSSPHRKSAAAWSRDQSNWQSEKHYFWLPVLESPWLPTILCLASSAVWVVSSAVWVASSQLSWKPEPTLACQWRGRERSGLLGTLNSSILSAFSLPSHTPPDLSYLTAHQTGLDRYVESTAY